VKRDERSGWRAFLGFALALALSLAGLVWPRAQESSIDRVVMIGARGLSWQAAVDLIEEGQLPTLADLVAGEAAVGDISADSYGGEGEILESIETGRLPFKQPSRKVWEEFERQGQEVSVDDVASAGRVLREEPDRHIFLSLSLGYVALDEMLGRLVAADGGDSTFLLFSEAGFFLAWGNHVKQAVQPHMVAPVDLAPTLLHVGGAEIPNDMDGVVLFQVFDEGFYHERRLAFHP
jgi:hypothetical protein